MHDLPEVDETTRKPEIIFDYYKEAVDTVDKMCAAYSVSRITASSFVFHTVEYNRDKRANTVFREIFETGSMSVKIFSKLSSSCSNERTTYAAD